ncbi:MAG: DUF63 family protein [Haloarculaceae archaeon]
MAFWRFSAVVALQVLPSGLAVPPPAYLIALAVGTAAVIAGLWRVRPRVTRRLIVALAPWMVAGAAGHALYQLDAAPDALAPLLGAPAVYVTAFVLAGTAVVAAMVADGARVSAWIAGTGALAAIIPAGAVLGVGASRGTLSLAVPIAALVVAVALAAASLAVFDRVAPRLSRRAGWLGALVVFGHALDGVSTAVGVDLLGTGERSPLPRAIMGVARSLPTADAIGSGWLFVLVKVVIAVGVLWLFADYLEDEPAQASVLLGVIAAVGLGPGTQNLLLFAATGGF